MGKIVRDKYPHLTSDDQEAIRQRAVATMNLTQRAKELATVGPTSDEPKANTALLDGVRKIAMDVRDLDIDLIDSINPFAAAYAVLAKSMDEATLKQVAAVISAKRTAISPEDAKDYALKAVKFKAERGRLPAIDAADSWERLLAEGAAAFVRFKDEGRYA